MVRSAAIPAVALFGSIAGILVAGTAQAHFLVLLPTSDVVEERESTTLGLQIAFTHPMQQGPAMEMARPTTFGVLAAGKRTDLLPSLEPRKLDGKTAYTASVRLTRPADYVFYLVPSPYWDQAEQKLIIHSTKVVVDFLGAEEGWDQRVGLPVEIEPLTRPYGLWTGNAFRGIVLVDGKPAPKVPVEVEYYNEGKTIRPPNDAFVTQVIKTDANGVFSYTMPRAGWWGFAALVPGPPRKGPEGKPVDVELGGLMWVKTVDMK